MKKMNKLAVAVGVALSLGVASQANAVMEFHQGGKGDVVLFPYYNGSEGWENYYTITNDSPLWIQGHLRFRGAAWCGELRDFDIILSPGDVFVFRIADIDGDGEWELDQSLDMKNFQYTGLVEMADQGDMDLPTSHCQAADGEKHWPCMDPSYGLIPEADAILTEDKIELQKQQGYIEFIGEAVLDGMDHNMMNILLSGDPGQWAPYQTEFMSHRGTTAWKWSNAEGQRFTNQFDVVAPTFTDPVWVGNRGLRDVPNVLSGFAVVSKVGQDTGLAYNAPVIANFRTTGTDHRIDNYRIDVNGNSLDVDNPVLVNTNRGVIVHNENGAASPIGISPHGDYIYGFQEEGPDPFNPMPGSLRYESLISFNNTWGPTLADGDDYNLSRFAINGINNVYGTVDREASTGLILPVNLRWTAGTGIFRFGNEVTGNALNLEIDDFDRRVIDRSGINSIAEVEEAVRVGGQYCSGFYFDGAGAVAVGESGSLQTWFHSWSFTKFFYGERADYYLETNLAGYIRAAAQALVQMPKTFALEVWDTEERTAGGATISRGQCVSPAIGPECLTTTSGSTGDLNLADCCGTFSISDVKARYSADVAAFTSGRAVFTPRNNDSVVDAEHQFRNRYSWPTLLYGYEMNSGEMAHWRVLNCSR
jgi:hypothetical protein